eukprot:jgi/Orpsp1_1/1178093/evm.model.c7180000064006.1
MKSFYNITYILGFIFLLINVIYAENDKSNNEKKISNEDKYYLIFIENKHGEYRIFKDKNNKNKKRDESAIFVESLLDEFNTIILDNKDTYKHPEVLEEIEESSKLRKRSEVDEENEFEYNYTDSDVIFPISSVDDTVVFYAYLSKELAEEFSKKPNVKACEPDIKTKLYDYNANDIFAETGWKETFMATTHVDSHLSLISQGKYSSRLVNKYDDTYYYPKSAGKGADIVVIDSIFDFTHDEFNGNNRVARCMAEVNGGRVTGTNALRCGVRSKSIHGKLVSDIAA